MLRGEFVMEILRSNFQSKKALGTSENAQIYRHG
jgi:hypothetical protein